MRARLMAAVADQSSGVNVSALCRELEISTKTFYKWRQRFEAEGLAGLEELSRRPGSNPRAINARVEDEIVRWRKTLVDAGLDGGPSSIRFHLERTRDSSGDARGSVPSVATIWRVLTRRGFITPTPSKRPRSSYRRFEADAPNEMWQMDFTHWDLAGGVTVDIYNIIDDCSRLLARSTVVKVANSDNAWSAWCDGVEQWGLPTRCLTDNGLQFSGRLHEIEVLFESRLRAAGVHKINSRPYHPQTCGKVERFHQTLKKWLRAHRRARSLRQLQAQLDEFADYYNHQRPHRALHGLTPFERWDATTKAASTGKPLDRPQRRTTVTVPANGAVPAGHRQTIGVGMTHAGKTATVIIDNGYAAVIIDHDLVRALPLDPTRTYHPTGHSPGRPPRH